MGKKRKVPKVSVINFESRPEDEQLFLESLKKLESEGLPSDAKIIEEIQPSKAQKRKDSGGVREKSGKKTRSGQQDVAHVIDLHGKTVVESKQTVMRKVFDVLQALGADELTKVRIITGKGRHSGTGGGVLIKEIYDFVVQTFSNHIVSIDESPSDQIVGELPIKGHFDFYMVASKRTR